MMTSGSAVAPELDRSRSPRTGWTRDHWVALLGRLTTAFADAAERGGSPARPWLPGMPAATVIEGLEGFARMSVAWGAWLGSPSNPSHLVHGNRNVDVEQLVVRGLLHGTTPGSPWAWGRIGDRDQRIVEAAELATGLWLGRDRLVPALGPDGVAQVLEWLDGVHGRDVYDDNWVLFPAFVATVQRALGRSVPDSRIDRGIDTMLARYAGDGWYSDGPGHVLDQYTGWAVHWHLLLWARIEGHRRPRVAQLVAQRARTHLATTLPQFAADGSRPLFGRSLGYRFAAVAPFALDALLGLDTVPPGLARRIASGVIARHLEQGAVDPATDWLRRGVAAERPDVCERYMRPGALAWATHALVALGLPPDAPFWRARERPLPVERGSGRVALRSAGFLIGWRRSTGETWLLNALSGHHDDIPGHDYTPYYGKLVYRSRFPFTVRTAAGRPGPDGAVLFDSTDAVNHRLMTDRGGVGPGWTWSAYTVETGGRRHRATTVVLPWRDVEVRLTGIRPDGPVRLVEGLAALGAATSDAVERRSSPAGGWASASTPEGSVTIRSLLGYDQVEPSGPGDPAGPDQNLVAEHAEQPTVAESRRSDRPRVVASVGAAIAGPAVPLRDLEAVEAAIDDTDPWQVTVRLGRAETAVVALGARPASSATVGGRRVEGAVRVVRAAADGSAFEGEAILSIEGVVRLDRPGPIAVRRARAGGARVDVSATDGFALDPGWARADLCTLSIRTASGWETVGQLAGPGRVPTATVRRLQRKTGTRLIDLRLEP